MKPSLTKFSLPQPNPLLSQHTLRTADGDISVNVDVATFQTKGGSYFIVPSVVVSMHFKSCVRQCSSTNPLSSMRPDTIREIYKALLGQ